MGKFGESRDPMYLLARSGYDLFRAGSELAEKHLAAESPCTADDLVHYVSAYCYFSLLRYRQYKQLPPDLTAAHLTAADKFLRKLMRELANSPRTTVQLESLQLWQQVFMCLLRERIQELRIAVSHLLEETGQTMTTTSCNLFFVDLGDYHNEIDTKEPSVAYDLQDELTAATNLWELIAGLGRES